MCVSVCVFFISRSKQQLKPQEVVQSLRGPLSLRELPAGPGKRLSSLSPSPTCVSFLSSYLIWVTHTQRKHTHPKGLDCPVSSHFLSAFDPQPSQKYTAPPCSVNFLPCYLSLLVCLQRPQLWRELLLSPNDSGATRTGWGVSDNRSRTKGPEVHHKIRPAHYCWGRVNVHNRLWRAPPQMLLLVMRANDVSGGPCLLISLNGGLIEVRERN